MAYEWVPNEPLLTHNGVTVYHVYKDDLVQSGTRDYWYSTDPDVSDDSEDTFDVRELSTWKEHKTIFGAIKAAIDKGEIVSDKEPAPLETDSNIDRFLKAAKRGSQDGASGGERRAAAIVECLLEYGFGIDNAIANGAIELIQAIQKRDFSIIDRFRDSIAD